MRYRWNFLIAHYRLFNLYFVSIPRIESPFLVLERTSCLKRRGQEVGNTPLVNEVMGLGSRLGAAM